MINFKQFIKEEDEYDDYGYEHPDITKKHHELASNYKFDEDEKYHIKKYTNDSSLINSYLWRTHKGNQEMKRPGNEYTAKTLSTALKQTDAPNNFHVYSGIKGDPREKMNSEGILHHPAFISASLNPNVSKSFAISNKSEENKIHSLKIHIPEGSNHGSYVGHISKAPKEREFIIDKGKNLKIHHTELVKEKDHHDIDHYIHHAEIV